MEMLFEWEALSSFCWLAEDAAAETGVRPLEVVALALRRDAWAAALISLLLIEIASLPAVPEAERR